MEFCKALDDKKGCTNSFFCDISKAFDRVWHQRLSYKFWEIGIKGDLLHWFANYLTDRKQRVVIRCQSSHWGDIKAAYAHGSNASLHLI